MSRREVEQRRVWVELVALVTMTELLSWQNNGLGQLGGLGCLAFISLYCSKTIASIAASLGLGYIFVGMLVLFESTPIWPFLLGVLALTFVNIYRFVKIHRETRSRP